MHVTAVEAGQLPLDLLPDAHIVLDGDGVLLAANQAFDRRLLAEPRAMRLMASVLDSPLDVAADIGGRRRVFSAMWSHCLYNGAPARLVRVADVTEERLHGDLLERHAHDVEEVLDALPASLLLVDSDGVIRSGNARWHVSVLANALTLAGAGVGASYLELSKRGNWFREPDARAIANGLQSVLQRRAMAFELEYHAPDESGDRWYQLSINALSGQTGAVIQHIETTDKHRQQDERLDAMAHFKAVFDGALDAIVIYDDDLRVLRANAVVGSFLATRPSTTPDFTLLDLVVPEDHELLMRQHAELLRSGTGRGVVRLRRHDGTVVEVEYASRANVVPGRHVAVARDMTAARELEAQLRQSQKMEALGQLTGGIAHDFNNLLTIVLAHADLLLSGDGLSFEAREGLAEILRASQRGADMVRKLMAFGRREQLRVEPTLLEPVVQDVSGILRRVLPETIVVQCLTHGDVPLAFADGSAVQQILLNLATNARDAMRDRGGELRIVLHAQAGPARTPDSQSRASSAQRHVVVSVSDTGCGMNAETLARMFEPFFTTKRLGEGTGLGMSMVYGLMEQMGGRVSVESQPEQGTTIHLHFPAVADARLTPSSLPSITPHVGRGDERILLVEDDDAIRALSARVLRRAGYTVTEAASGDAAFEFLRQQRDEGQPPVDLVVSDVVMPHGDGYRVLEATRQYAAASRIVWVTGYAGGGYADGDVHAPCDAPLIQKPWTTSELLARIRAVLDGPPNVPPDNSRQHDNHRAG